MNRTKRDPARLILLQYGGVGDNLFVTPVIRQARRRWPQAQIEILASYPELFSNNPYVNNVCFWRSDPRISPSGELLETAIATGERFCRLSYVISGNATHVVLQFCHQALGTFSHTDTRLELFLTKREQDEVGHYLPQREFVCIQSATASPFTSNKEYFTDRFQQVVDGLAP